MIVLNSELFIYGASPEHHLAFGAAMSRSGSNGWRDSNDEQFDILLGTLKWDFTTSDSLLFSASYRRQQFDDEFLSQIRIRFPRRSE